MNGKGDELRRRENPMTRPVGEPLATPERSADALRRDVHYLAGFERLIINLSGRFINSNSRSIDRDISEALAAIGSFAAVDRSYVFQFAPQQGLFSNTHEWCANGIEPGIQDLQDLPMGAYSWTLSRFLKGEVVHIPNVAGLPRSAEPERRKLQSQGIRSLVNVPLKCANKVIGFVGFDSVRSRKTWSEEHIKLLKLVGEIIAGAIERERATATLTRQVELEKLVAQISTNFINIASDDIDDEIQCAIEKIGAFTGVDRSYVFRFSADGRTMDNTHEWCAAGIEAHIKRLQGHPVDAFDYSIALMKRGEVFRVPNVADLPSKAARERQEFEQEGIKTLVNVPMMVRGVMIGFLGLDAVRVPRIWSDDDMRLLGLVGETVANAIDRQESEERLRISLQEKEVLLREIHHRVKNNLQVIHSMLYLQANAIRGEADSLALEAFRQSQSRVKSMAAIHDRLYRAKDLSGIDFADYLNELIPDLLALYDSRDRIRVEIEEHTTHLDIDTAIPCGLIVNELVANCLKHAFPNKGRGTIAIGLRERSNGLFELAVADDGIGFSLGKDWRETKSLGLLLVSDLVDQLGGEVMLETGERGTAFRAVFPAPW
jgi:two-component sensor histidine kinase